MSGTLGGIGAFADRWFGKAPLLLAIALAFLAPSLAAAAEPLRITDLQVNPSAYGEDAWYASNVFHLYWAQVPEFPKPRLIVYSLYDSEGRLVAGPFGDSGAWRGAAAVAVPRVPGAYTIEAQLEDASGQTGPPAHATLRFDDAAPTAPAPIGPTGWVTNRESVRLKIGHPPGPLPVSGIRGYAISIDDGGGSSPCEKPAACRLEEIDLPGGIGDDTIDFGLLQEGTTFARVLAVSGSGVASQVASVAIAVDGTPPQSSLQGVPGGWSSGPVQLTAVASDALSGMAAAGPSGPFTAIAVDGGAPALAAGDTVSTWVTGNGAHQVSSFARDGAGNVSKGALGLDSAVVRIDEEPPRVAFAVGQDPAEPERIDAKVADPLSGPSAGRGAIQLRPAGSRARFEELPTRVVGDRLIAHWDSDSYPPGAYEFLATGYDRAGNAASGGRRASGGEMVLLSPLKEPVQVEAGFGGRQLVWQRCKPTDRGRRCRRQRATSFEARPARRTVPFGHGVRFSGRLQGPAGTDLGGLEVGVEETFAPGAEPRQRTTVVRTAPDGSFTLQLAPGPSREVTASFAGTRTLTRASARSVHLGVLAAARLRVSATTARIGGAPVVFSGSVDRAGLAGSGRGLPVELQFRYPGADWSEFRTVETNAHGGWHYAYRFSDDDSRGIRFQFRAYVNGREGWPYEPGASRPVSVTGH